LGGFEEQLATSAARGDDFSCVLSKATDSPANYGYIRDVAEFAVTGRRLNGAGFPLSVCPVRQMVDNPVDNPVDGGDRRTNDHDPHRQRTR
jgi:hypothetical protein